MSVTTTVTVTQEEASTVTSDVPKEWHVLRSGGAPVPYAVSSDPEDYFSHDAVSARWWSKASLREVLAIYGDDPTAVDVAEWALLDQKRAEDNKDFTDIEALPERTIDGSTAYGYTYINRTSHTPVRVWLWTVGRADGLWEISAVSTSTSPQIPADVATVLDTLAWT